MRALIIDDSTVMRKIVERTLRQTGVEWHEVLHASSGLEALDILRVDPELHLIVSDVSMPGMDGLTFLERRRDEGLAPGTPAVIVTSETHQPLVLRAIHAGARAYLLKPFTSEQARARILPLLQPHPPVA